MATLLLRNLIFGDSATCETGDLLIRDGVIAAVGMVIHGLVWAASPVSRLA